MIAIVQAIFDAAVGVALSFAGAIGSVISGLGDEVSNPGVTEFLAVFVGIPVGIALLTAGYKQFMKLARRTA